MFKNLKNKIAHRTLNYLFSLKESDVFTIDKSGAPKINGNHITREQLSTLDQEAKYIKSTWLWKILTGTLEDKAKEVIFINSEDSYAILSGKLTLRSIDIQKKIVDNICKAYAKTNQKTEDKESEGKEEFV